MSIPIKTIAVRESTSLLTASPLSNVQSRSRARRLQATTDKTMIRPRSEIPSDLKPGDYFKPPTEQTSGFIGSSASFKRSPCPALNALANHGYIPRDGKGVNLKQVSDAIEQVYGLGSTLTYLFALLIRVVSFQWPFSKLDLSDLSTHHQAEHDTSLAHDDMYFGNDPCHPNPDLVELLCSRSKDGTTLQLPELIEHRLARQADSKARNPQYRIGAFLKFCASVETSLFLNVLGHKGSIPISHAKSFLIDERIPDDFVRPDYKLGGDELGYVSGQIKELTQQPGQI